MKKLAFVFGTRPEIIKLAPLFRLCEEKNQPYILIHTNQHYSPELDAIFFEELNLPAPHFNLHVGAGTQTEQTAKMMTSLEKHLVSEKPDVVIVQGDTNSVLAGALVASKLGIPIAHIEAGLRSFDRAMPEEINRIITDHISTYLFPPTSESEKQLLSEGIAASYIHNVGNTVVESVLAGRELSAKSTILSNLSLTEKSYFLLTLHRPSNVDSPDVLANLLTTLDQLSADHDGQQFIWPIHPRTRHTIEQNKIAVPKSINLIEPVGYRDFIALQVGAHTIFTDSGGIQEEACILGIPCITLRDTTERPETITVGANKLVHNDRKKMEEALAYFQNQTQKWENPFGDGTTGTQILSILNAD